MYTFFSEPRYTNGVCLKFGAAHPYQNPSKLASIPATFRYKTNRCQTIWAATNKGTDQALADFRLCRFHME